LVCPPDGRPTDRTKVKAIEFAFREGFRRRHRDLGHADPSVFELPGLRFRETRVSSQALGEIRVASRTHDVLENPWVRGGADWAETSAGIKIPPLLIERDLRQHECANTLI
jgi:hypothetical protein